MYFQAIQPRTTEIIIQEKDKIYAHPTLDGQQKTDKAIIRLDEMQKIGAAARGDAEDDGLNHEFIKHLSSACVIR